MRASTVKLSLDYLRDQGWLVDVVERWIPNPVGGPQVRKDLFGLFDLVAVRGLTTCGVQVTTKGEMSRRARKIARSDTAPVLAAAGWRLIVHGWHQPNGPRTRYVLEELEIELSEVSP